MKNTRGNKRNRKRKDFLFKTTYSLIYSFMRSNKQQLNGIVSKYDITHECIMSRVEPQYHCVF